jgi:ABC-type nitrate/sulfonate/bicarbonate transport system substrate-binding protein
MTADANAPQKKRQIVIRPSKWRLVFWGLCLAVIGWLAWVGPFSEKKDAPSVRDPVVESTVTRYPVAGDQPGGIDPAAPPVLRIGVMNRAAHAVVLNALEANLFAVLLQEHGRVDSEIFTRAAELANAVDAGELDLACMPLRDAVALVAKGSPVRVIAGAATRDEQYVIGKGLTKITFKDLTSYRFGLADPPTLDVAAVLGQNVGAVEVLSTQDVIKGLSAGTLDAAILPEPHASTAALGAGARLLPAEEVGPAGALTSGAVVVVRDDAATRLGETLAHLLEQLEFSRWLVTNDPVTAIDRARTFLVNAGVRTPDGFVWEQAVRNVTLDTVVPIDALRSLARLANTDDARAQQRLLNDAAQRAARTAFEAAQHEPAPAPDDANGDGGH